MTRSSLSKASARCWRPARRTSKWLAWRARGREAIQLVMEKHPDIILMDVRMPEMDGVEATKIIHETYPDIHVLMLTTFDDDEYVVEALNHGAAGYMLKDMPPADLIVSLRAVCKGSIIISPQVANKLLRMREGEGKAEEGTPSPSASAPRRVFPALPEQTRDRDPAAHRDGRRQRPHCPKAFHRGADGEEPRERHLLQASRPQQDAGHEARQFAEGILRPGRLTAVLVLILPAAVPR